MDLRDPPEMADRFSFDAAYLVSGTQPSLPGSFIDEAN
jgi:hypothetical protein